VTLEGGNLAVYYVIMLLQIQRFFPPVQLIGI